jgi:23S rRNA pseudouridine2605 synthase
LEERLHKVLAQHGLGSRRQVEEWIRAGRIEVNGRPATIGQRIRASDRIVVDGRDVTRRVATAQRLRVIVYHKPGGELQRGRAGDDRSPVDARLPSMHAGRWLPINTVGFAEDGVLVLTNDGALAAAAGRRGRELPVEYRVRVLRPREAADWPAVPRAIDVDGQRVEFAAIDRLDAPGSNVWFRVEASRAVPRGAVRAVFDAAGLKVSRILLTRWGPIALPRDLPRGRSRELAGTELAYLLALAGRDRPTRPVPPTGKRIRRPSRRRSGAR